MYIAYGSNLNTLQMRRRCPTAVPLCTAMLPGYDLLFRGSRWGAVATIEPGEDTVPVLLWKLKPEDEKALDAYEGWPTFYRKEYVDVEVNGKPVRAMVYIMNDGHPLGSPSQGYLNTIIEGYETADFDAEVLVRALNRSMPEPVQTAGQEGGHAQVYE
jgi:gamma-glutamylcyclotransferase (GGCT)/AIG2-like uncharacterized protein YtfP